VTRAAVHEKVSAMSNATDSQQHGRPAGNAPDAAPPVAAPSHAERARTLIESAASATLCTLAREPAGYPYGSLVTFALHEHRPVFLISELAEHTRNLRAEARASLLVSESRPGDPLANGRVTLLGVCSPADGAERDRARDAYLTRHPSAGSYASFSDFSFWTLEVGAVRYIGGYGRMSWIQPNEWLTARPDPIAPDAAAILAHMNQDHADALPLYLRAFASVTEVLRVEMSSIDRLGFELSVGTSQGTQTVRLAFHEPIASKNDARKALVGLLREARTKLGIAG
jgi:putative heme iron utilization protein